MLRGIIRSDSTDNTVYSSLSLFVIFYPQATRGRGTRGKVAGRPRRSADDQEGDETTGENGTSLVGQVVEGVKNLVMGEGTTTAEGGEKGTTATRGGKAKRGRGAAKAPRVRKERGEPSKTVSRLFLYRSDEFSYSPNILIL